MTGAHPGWDGGDTLSLSLLDDPRQEHIAVTRSQAQNLRDILRGLDVANMVGAVLLGPGPVNFNECRPVSVPRTFMHIGYLQRDLTRQALGAT